jgi:hypothetical protein
MLPGRWTLVDTGRAPLSDSNLDGWHVGKPDLRRVPRRSELLPATSNLKKHRNKTNEMSDLLATSPS